MAKKHAKTLREEDLPALLNAVTAKAADSEVMRLAFMLSYYAGLRVQEIAGLKWDTNIFSGDDFYATSVPIYGRGGRPIRNPDTGKIKMKSVPAIFVGSDIGKYGSERTVPLHTELEKGLKSLYRNRKTEKFVIPSGRPGADQALRKRAHALKMRINRMYMSLEKEGFTSHSGRRTFITNGAQKANAFGTSLRDVQLLAGHRSLTTTQDYIAFSDRQAALVQNLYGGS